MTTAAHAIPALEVSAPDDNMDVLSDTAFDFGDGDIDLDLDTAPSVHDDDMSLNDAATEGGVDMSEHIDQDDFMADEGDLIEEDDVYNDDAATISQNVDEGAVSVEADMLAPPDEDLIDYSDDEAQQPVTMHSPSVHEEEEAQVTYNPEPPSIPTDEHVEDTQPQVDAHSSEPAPAEEMQSQKDDDAKNLETTDASAEHEKQDAELQHESSDEAHIDDEGGIALTVDDYSQPDETATELCSEQQEDAAGDHASVHYNDQQIELRPVTVNYAGNELWLFKQHDLDDSGDFLLEDLSVAKSSISNLFQACRVSLGDDVSGEHELGFRFDHLHNLELYEDNTACVAVSLERMVGLYHTLQAQDGNEDPECFYITLQFRPRFATLLADIAQYAEQGSGYSALDAAVSAGETHFSNVFSGASTEHDHVAWDEEEYEDNGSSPASVHSIAHGNAEAEESAEQQIIGVEEQVESFDQEQTHQQQGIALEQESEQTPGAREERSHVAQEAPASESSDHAAALSTAGRDDAKNETEPEAVERHASETQDERTPDQIAHEKQEAEDFVDYSDDEDEQEDKPATHEPSPASSTVQGDDVTEVQEQHSVTDSADPAEVSFEEPDDTTLLTQTQYGDDVNHYAFQDYTEAYEQGDSFQDYHAHGNVGDAFEASGSYTGDTNQDFADYNFQEMEGEIILGFDEQPSEEANHGDYGDETYDAVEDVTHTDALLDLDNAPEWAVDTDPASKLPGEDAMLVHDDTTVQEDKEGGALEQPGATTSSAANLASISSNGREPLSPQGQKRSIDEVGDGTDDAPNSTDAKKARV